MCCGRLCINFDAVLLGRLHRSVVTGIHVSHHPTARVGGQHALQAAFGIG